MLPCPKMEMVGQTNKVIRLNILEGMRRVLTGETEGKFVKVEKAEKTRSESHLQTLPKLGIFLR
jgi:hypothetical protein